MAKMTNDGQTFTLSKCILSCSGRDAHRWAPPGQIRTSAIERIRLLRWMSSVEACIRLGMQNTGFGNPSIQEWRKSLPPHLCSLAARTCCDP